MTQPVLLELDLGLGTGAQRAELLAADWRLVWVWALVVREAHELGCAVRLSSVARTVAETQALYAGTGRAAPAQVSVHDTRPLRGVDGYPDPLGQHELDLGAIGQAVADRVNELVRYPRAHRAVLWHDVAGRHWHAQVPHDGLELGADPRRPASIAWGGEA